MSYYLYPPFFVVPEASSFADAWELFCCKVLNLKEGTDEIYRVGAPESGMDLFFPSKAVAYQCKSVESGKRGDFNVSHAIESIEQANAVKRRRRWKKYGLCTNVDLTGPTEDTLRDAAPDLLLYPRSYWLEACREHSQAVEGNFRRLLTIPPKRVIDTIDDGFYPNYSQQLKTSLQRKSYHIFLYSNHHDRVYRVHVSPDFKVKDLLHIFRCFFKLPRPKTIERTGITCSLSHAVVVDGEMQTFSHTLAEAGIHEGTVVTYATTVEWEEAERHESFRGTVIHLETMRTASDVGSEEPGPDAAIRAFKADMHTAFEEFDGSLPADEKGDVG